MSGIEINPLIVCLLGSLIWAPLVYWRASKMERDGALSYSEKLWLGALGVAAAPTLIAPLFKMAGLSLRKAPILVADPAPLTITPAIFETPAPGAAETVSIIPEAALAAENFAPASGLMLDWGTLETVLGAVTIIYVYGFALAAIVTLSRWIGFGLSISGARDVNDDVLIASVEKWRDRMGVTTPLRIKTAPNISSVCVYGAIRPVILLPEDLLRRVSRDDAILMCAHELAHIQRGDARLFAICAIANTIFWFNPLMKRITARAALCAEQSADALVLETGVKPKTYAACFVEGLRFAAQKNAGALGRFDRAFTSIPSFTPFDKKSRRMRLDAILSVSSREAGGVKSLPLLIAAALGATIAFAQAGFAVNPDPVIAPSAPEPKVATIAPAINSAPVPNAPLEASLAEPVVVPMPVKPAPVSPAAAQPIVIASAEPAPAPLRPSLLILPVDGRITQHFGELNKAISDKKHKGIDIAAPRGAPVRAAAGGKVVTATNLFENKPSWGKVVVIAHKDGMITRYAHLGSYSVSKGDRVKKGEVIAKVGTTGKVTGPHLHFETIRNRRHVDPAGYLVASAAAPAPAPKPDPSPVVKPSPAPSPDEHRSHTVKFTEDGVVVASENWADELEGWSEEFSYKFSENFGHEFTEEFAEEFKDNFAFVFDDDFIEQLGLPDAQSFAEMAAPLRIAAADLARMSPEDRESIREAQEEALEAIAEAKQEMHEAMREAKEEARAARKEALKEAKEKRKHAKTHSTEYHEKEAKKHQSAERQREREQAQRQRERAQRDRDRAQRARDKEQRARDRVQRDRERAESHAENRLEHRMRALEEAERAIEAAQRDLEEQRRDIAEQRAELERRRSEN